MSDESDQKPAEQVGIGVLLKKRRQSLKFSLSSVELATKIRGKYLVLIEQGDYEKLPNDIYTRGFISKYAEYLGLDAGAITAQYLSERGAVGDSAKVGAPKPVKSRRFVVTPRLVIAGAFLLVLGLVVAYLSLQFSQLAAPPKLSVKAPPGDLVVEGSVLTVAGSVAGGADVTINDSPVLTDADGGFSNQLALQDGLNTIKVVAKNKLGKASSVTRNILAHLPHVGTSEPLVPAAPFDGVAVGVTVKDSAVNITATIDGGKRINITMLPGASKTFTAKSKVRLETSNSASTALMVTNLNVASKDLGIVGKGGALKLEFAKETAFP